MSPAANTEVGAATPVPQPRAAAEYSARAGDLVDRNDVELLVRTFYERAFADPLLGPIFLDIAHLDLTAHLPVMCDFWETVLFRAGLYHRNAFDVHARLHAEASLTAAHFRRWLQVWVATTDDLFTGPRADTAKLQAGRMAWAISRRLLTAADNTLLIDGATPVRTGDESARHLTFRKAEHAEAIPRRARS